MKYCTKCGEKISINSKFCTSCGEKIINKTQKIDLDISQIEDKNKMPHVPNDTIKTINKKIELENNQTSITKKLWYAAGFFLLVILIGFSEIIEVHPSIIFLSIFFCLSSVVIGFMFRSRGEKLQKLISGERLIASWTLTSEQKEKYINYLFEQESGRNKIILFTISVIAIVVFGIFILVIDEGKLAMFGVLIGLIIFLSIFAFGMPYYYRHSNKRGDGNILIGAKYAYINGYFHNWDFLLSGLSKIKVIEEPFYGINIVYYYTDRTLSHSEELFIPANQDIDLQSLLQEMKIQNMKKSKK